MRLLSSLSLILIAICLQANPINENCFANSELAMRPMNVESLETMFPDWKVLNDTLFTIEYPDTWEMTHTGNKGLSFLAMTPLEGEKDRFRENLSLVIQSMKANDSSLEDFVGDNTAQIIDLINEGKLIKNEEVVEGKMKYREVIYSGIQNNIEIITTQRYIFHNGDAYIFIFTRDLNGSGTFDKDGTRIMNSFKLK